MFISRTSILLTLSFLFFFSDCRSQSGRIDRQPAVAGQFYPAKREELNEMLRQLFTKAAPRKNIKDVVAIISPHAGYVFSGVVAASSFHQIDSLKEYKIFLSSDRVTTSRLKVHPFTRREILLRLLERYR